MIGGMEWLPVSTELLDPLHELHPQSRGEPACEAFAWIDLMGMTLRDGRGSRVRASVRTLAVRWQWSKSRVQRFLNALSQQGKIKQWDTSGTQAGHITLCNPSRYAKPWDTSGTQAGHYAPNGRRSRVSASKTSELGDLDLALPLSLATQVEKDQHLGGGWSGGGNLEKNGMTGNGEIGAEGTRTEEDGHVDDVSLLLPGVVENGGGHDLGPRSPAGVSDRVGRAAIRAVLEGCERITGHKLKPLDGRVRKIRARLEDGYTVPQLVEAMRKAHADPFFRGDNDRGKRYDWPETVFKNSEAVEHHLAYQSDEERQEAQIRGLKERYEEAYGADVGRA